MASTRHLTPHTKRGLTPPPIDQFQFKACSWSIQPQTTYANYQTTVLNKVDMQTTSKEARTRERERDGGGGVGEKERELQLENFYGGDTR